MYDVPSLLVYEQVADEPQSTEALLLQVPYEQGAAACDVYPRSQQEFC